MLFLLLKIIWPLWILNSVVTFVVWNGSHSRVWSSSSNWSLLCLSFCFMCSGIFEFSYCQLDTHLLKYHLRRSGFNYVHVGLFFICAYESVYKISDFLKNDFVSPNLYKCYECFNQNLKKKFFIRKICIFFKRIQ